MLIEKEESVILLGNGINRYIQGFPINTDNTDNKDKKENKENKENKEKASWGDLLVQFYEKLRVRKNYKNKDIPKVTVDILKNKYITYPEIFDAIYNSCTDKIMRSNKTDIKKTLCNVIIKDCVNRVEKYKNLEQNVYTTLLDFAINNGIPILTTNFDYKLVMNIKEFINPKDVGKNPKTYRPIIIKGHDSSFGRKFMSYFSSSKQNGFKIYQIHGYPCYPSTISIGAQDYAEDIIYYKRLIYNKHNGLYTYETKEKNTKSSEKKSIEISGINTNWVGSNTWLDTFLNSKHLYIVGVGLESQETSLRWLFQERKKYLQIQKQLGLLDKEPRNAYYVDAKDIRSTDEFEGKSFYFKSLNIEYISLDSCSDIYDTWDYIEH